MPNAWSESAKDLADPAYRAGALRCQLEMLVKAVRDRAAGQLSDEGLEVYLALSTELVDACKEVIHA